ncbi:MAG: 4Fe-4S binding protein [Methanomassiliicoccus sp.]|nr:4Fe-4S binding protein [Methanomassiliicoccus sp.]
MMTVEKMDENGVNTLRYLPGRCVNCGRCSEVCPHRVFLAGERRAVLSSPDQCMECGACMLNCPAGAIMVDSGVGCAAAMIKAALTGSKEVTCGPDCCGR